MVSMTSARVRAKLRDRKWLPRSRRWRVVMAVAALVFTLMLILGAPKNVPSKLSSYCPGGPYTAASCFDSVIVPDDGLTSPIIENPVPPSDQLPVLPATVLLIGLTAGGALVIVAIPRLRRRTI